VVRAIGAGVTTLKVGSRVAWINCLGSYASQVVLPVAQAIVVPEHFRVEEALLFQAVTAQYLLSEYRTVNPGDVVLVHAAAGGVGQLLVQWLKHLGAAVIGTASSEAKLDVVRSLGADHAINYADGEFLDAVLDVTNGRGVDIAFDAVGAATFASTLKALAPRGLALIYGQASGSAPAIDPQRHAGGGWVAVRLHPGPRRDATPGRSRHSRHPGGLVEACACHLLCTR